MEDITRMEERKGERVWVGYDKIRINDQWRWDEEEEVLWDERGNRRQEKWEEREEEGMGG